MRAEQHAPETASNRTPSETAMRWLLVALIALMVVADLFDFRMSLGPGLTIENALLYILAVGLVFKLIVQQPFVFQLRALHMAFAMLIFYSFFSLLTAAFVIDYPRYRLIPSGMSLKARLVDQVTYFLVFFYALRETQNAHKILKILLIVVGVGATIALLNAFGVVQIGEVGENEKGRVESLMGEPNQDAAFLALFIPGLVVMMMAAPGLQRIAWAGVLLASLGALLLTASRGGFVGLVMSAIWGAVLFRKYVPFRRLAQLAAGAVVVFTAVTIALSVRYGGLLYRRFIEDSTYTDVASASSGRIEIWTKALGIMIENPLTLLTGFGWDVYGLMPLRYAPHNYYLNYYFNLGLVGLVCGTLFFVLLIREARAGVASAPAQYKAMLIAFSIGTLAIAIATFFVDLYTPWIWFWAYAGLVMRIAVNARTRTSMAVAHRTIEEPALKDPFGWAAPARQR